MKEHNFSQTALKTACYRAYHAGCDNPKIFDDFLAYDFVGEMEFASFRSQMLTGFKTAAPELAASFPDEAAILAFMMQAMAPPALTVSRARYAEDTLMESLKYGVQQYVILGAGMDTFAFRRPELMENLQVFEVDHPATQEFNRLRLNQLGWECPSQLHFVPIDFTKESVATVLKRSMYNPNSLSFFNWLGVTYYLPRDVVFATLQTIAEASPPGSRIVFDFLDSDLLIPEKAAPRAQQILLLGEQIGEPIKAVFDPAALTNDLAGAGFRLVENLSPPEIQEHYFNGRSDNYYACENAHFACAVVE
ncbi:MAG: SAM-dependent methyltransferase [Firmicutes bacterium HGW-Firmicutes-15]|nr:MAG: SAM-dependent methyltransferase [Firmicutes bacterium HGW-Firmicutes-15]